MLKAIRILTIGLAISILLTGIIIAYGAMSFARPGKVTEAYSWRFEQVGYSDLGGKAAFKMAMQEVGGRWYLYLAHFWTQGWSVVDVTDPENPKHLKFIKGPENTSTGNIQVADGLMVTQLERPTYELVDHMPWTMYAWAIVQYLQGKPLVTPGIQYEEGVLIWDVSDPVNPKKLSHWKTGNTGTHRNYYAGGDYAWLAGHKPDTIGHQIITLDVSDPKAPQEVGSFAFPEQLNHEASEESRSHEGYYFHGPIHIEGDRGFASYGIKGAAIFDVSNKADLKLIGLVNPFPEIGSVQGVHGFIPLGERKLSVINTEAHDEHCKPDPGESYTAIVDLSDEANPQIISFFPDPIVDKKAPYASFCERPGRSGVHNQHHHNNQPHLYKSDRFVFLAKFNEGVRLYDTQDPNDVKEVGYYVPPDPQKRLGPMPSALVAQTEDVLVDSRGYIYITDKNQGLRILRSTYQPFVDNLARSWGTSHLD